jgi:predicted enzyme related to lactoylglutathione lyase
MPGVVLKLLVLKTRQIEKVRAFYTTLGIKLTDEKHGDGPLHYAGKVGDTVLEVYPLLDADSAADSTTRLGFAVEDLSARVQSLLDLGTQVVSGPRQTAWGIRAIVRDPDGRAVELYEK